MTKRWRVGQSGTAHNGNAPRYREAHVEPRHQVHLGSWEHLADPTGSPEDALIAREEAQEAPECRAGGAALDLGGINPVDALALDWWTMGLSMSEIGQWLGVGKVRVHQRIHRGINRLRQVTRQISLPLSDVVER